MRRWRRRFAATIVCFCYDRRGNLLHPFKAEMRPGAVATVFAATVIVFGYNRRGFSLHPVNGVDWWSSFDSCNPVQRASTKNKSFNRQR